MARFVALAVFLLGTGCGSQPPAAPSDPRIVRALAEHHAWIPSARCAYEHLGVAGSRQFIYHQCSSPDESQGAAGPAMVHVGSEPYQVAVPRDGSYYAADVATMFPPDVQRVLRSEREMAVIQKRVSP